MGQIVLLAFAAAVFPTLIACVAVMISRPEPRGLLLAFYLGGLISSLTSGVVVLAYISDGNAVLGSTSSTPSPGTSIVAGLVSLLLAWLMASRRGDGLLDRWRSRHPRRHEKKQGPSWAERHLNRANARVAFVRRCGDQSTRTVLPARARRHRDRQLHHCRAARSGRIVQRDHVRASRGATHRVPRATRRRPPSGSPASRPGSTPTACESWAGSSAQSASA